MSDEKILGSEDLEVGVVFKDSNRGNYHYVYLGAKPYYDWESTDDNVFSSHYQTEEFMMHVFYCIEREEYTSLKWSNATKTDEVIDAEIFKIILSDFYNYPIGKKIKSVEFHINHLNYNAEIPFNVEKSKFAIFYQSFFKEIDKENRIYLAITLKDEDDYPNVKNYDASLIKIVESEAFHFDYIPIEQIDKYKGVININEVEETISAVKEITKKNVGFMGMFSKSIKEKHIQDKLKAFQALDFGALYVMLSSN